MTWFIYAIVASLGLSIVTLLQKRVLKGEHAMEFVTTLSLLNLVISFPLFLTIDYQSLKIVPLLIIAATSIFSSISITLNARSLRHMEVSASSPLYVLTPAVSALLGLIFLGEYLSFYQSLGIGILIIGTFLLEIDSYTKIKSFRVFMASKYVYYILLSILLFGISALIDRFVLTRYNMQPQALLAFAHLYISIILLVYFSIRYDGLKGVKKSFKTYGWALVLISLLTVFYRFSEIKSMQLISVGLVVAVVKSSSLFTTIIGGKLFNEKNLILKVFACLIMIIGMILVVV